MWKPRLLITAILVTSCVPIHAKKQERQVSIINQTCHRIKVILGTSTEAHENEVILDPDVSDVAKIEFSSMLSKPKTIKVFWYNHSPRASVSQEDTLYELGSKSVGSPKNLDELWIEYSSQGKLQVRIVAEGQAEKIIEL